MTQLAPTAQGAALWREAWRDRLRRLLPGGDSAAGGAPRRRRRRGRRWFGSSLAIGIAIVLAACVIRPMDPFLLRAVRLKVFDQYQRMHPRQVTQGAVAIIDIDERSLAELGQWPWPRSIVAEIVQRLTEAGVAAIGFDVVFAEPDRLSPGAYAESLRGASEQVVSSLRAMPGNDDLLARELAGSPVVLGRVGVEEAGAEALPANAGFGLRGGDPKPFLIRFPGLVANIPALERSARGSGLFSLAPEDDGVVRRVPALAVIGERIYPALSLEMLRLALQRPAYLVTSGADGVQEIALTRELRIPTDPQGRIWVNYAPPRTTPYISAVDVLRGAVPQQQLAGRLMLLGTSAVGLKDLRTTPVAANLPGVEVHANLLETILTGSYLRRPGDVLGMEIVATMAVGLLIVVLVPLTGPLLTLAVFLAAAGGMVATSWYLYTREQLLLDATFPVGVALLLYVVTTLMNYSRARAERQQVRGAFSQYLSPALVEQLAGDPDRLQLGGEVKTMSFLFCDVRGFTAISEQFKADPQGLTRLINRFLTPMTDAILARRGTIDKYMGDCIMAFWNAPLDDADHARHAAESALAMLDELSTLNAALAAEAEADGRTTRPLAIGIGINTGDCVVGNMGSQQRFDYSVLGDAVNLASRLEGQSKTYGVDIVLGEDAARRIAGFALIELDRIVVKGKAEPGTIFALLGGPDAAAGAAFGELRAAWDEVLASYRAQQWDAAEAAIARCRALDPRMDELCALYAERIAEYRVAPPPEDWDYVYRALSK